MLFATTLLLSFYLDVILTLNYLKCEVSSQFVRQKNNYHEKYSEMSVFKTKW